LVLPLYDEPETHIRHFLNHRPAKPVVVIMVFNSPEALPSDSDNAIQLAQEYDARIRSQKSLEDTVSITGAQLVGDHLYSAKTSGNCTLYLLDRCCDDYLIPRKQGVGLARKLGMDLAIKLTLMQFERHHKIASWIHSCDADVVLPEAYFDIPAPTDTDAVSLYPFEHVAEPGYEQSMALYEFSLRYYVEQLHDAGSPYAFHSIGSLIAVSPLAYVQVRGMPKRSGAEDFYLLNKLAKVGRINALEKPLLQVAGRPSHRVPFGTGPAISKIKSLSDPINDYQFYNPATFAALKCLLTIVSEAEQSISSVDILFQKIQDRMPLDVSRTMLAALVALKIKKQFKHFSQKKDAASFRQAFHTWFDGFVTLRFIHILRDACYPNVSLAQLPQSEALSKVMSLLKK
jgi:hypothetical protein